MALANQHNAQVPQPTPAGLPTPIQPGQTSASSHCQCIHVDTLETVTVDVKLLIAGIERRVKYIEHKAPPFLAQGQCWMQNAEHKVQHAERQMQNAKCKMQMQNAERKMQNADN